MANSPLNRDVRAHQMASISFARALLEHWGIKVSDIPTSRKKEADFLATFRNVKVLIEEKTKEDDTASLEERDSELEQGKIYSKTLPLTAYSGQILH